GGKSSQITDHAASERDHERRSFGTELQKSSVDLVQCGPVFVRFAVRQDYGIVLNTAFRQGRTQGLEEMRGDGDIGDHDGTLRARREELTDRAQKVHAD